MTRVVQNPTLPRPHRQPKPRFGKRHHETPAAVADRHNNASPRTPAVRPRPAPIRLPLGQRYALRHAIAYAVETSEGEIGFVTEVRIAPYAYWPEELVVQAPDGQRLRVPVSTVSAVHRREGRLLVTTAPAGAQPVARPREPWLSKTRVWRIAAAAGAALGLGGYVATLFALALDVSVAWGPGLAASGALGGAASAATWREQRRSWPAAIGLGSFWLPLVAGVILSLVLLFR